MVRCHKIYVDLHVKYGCYFCPNLNKIRMDLQILVDIPNMKFRENPPMRAVLFRAEGLDMAKLG
jgi:hypothetical protein